MKAVKRKCHTCKTKGNVADMHIDGLKATCKTPGCMAAYGLWKLSKAKEAKERALKVKHIKQKNDFNDNDLRLQHKLTQKAFNKMRKLEELAHFYRIGVRPYCISCLKTDMDWCCGHYKTVSSQGILRYDRINTYLQCNRYCNMGLSANISGNKNTIGYTKGIMRRFGDDEGSIIINYCDTTKSAKKWTCEEVKQIRIDARARIKYLTEQFIG